MTPRAIHPARRSCIIAEMRSGMTGAYEAAGPGAYASAGVDIDAGARAVELMRESVRATFGSRVLADLGHFGGLYALSDEPDGTVLVASADGVGTKLKLAFALGSHRNAGMDIVNHCVNDILTCGARP